MLKAPQSSIRGWAGRTQQYNIRDKLYWNIRI
jgi:hypothetical protein